MKGRAIMAQVSMFPDGMRWRRPAVPEAARRQSPTKYVDNFVHNFLENRLLK